MLSKPKFRDASKNGVLLLRRWRRRECRLQGVVAKSSYQCCHQPVQNDGEEDTEWVKHKERLLHISQRLSQQNLQDLLFLVHDIIMPTSFDSVVDLCTKLFQELHQKGHVGVNNYSKLKRWLVEIGRMDLARELPGTPTHKDQSSTAVNKRQQSHRFLMLQVSESLRKAEVQRLVYLCSAIPQSLHKTITEGFHLFQELEQRGLISPENYGYIAECLRCIGREDLAYQLTHRSIHSSPHSFRQAEQMLRFLYRQKRQSYQSFVTDLDNTLSRQAWMIRLDDISSTILATWSRKTATTMSKAVQCTSTTLDEMIQLSLKAIFAFLISEAQSVSAIMKSDIRSFKRCSEQCNSLYREFDEALEKIGWSPSTRQMVALLCNGMLAPNSCSKAANGVSRSIQSFCREFLGEGVQVEFKCLNENIQEIESTYYHAYQKKTMMEWISDLISLGQTSAIDLHRHMATLTQLLSQHEHIITQAMPTISDIVGKEITDITTPLLPHAPPEDLTDETPLQTESEYNIITVHIEMLAVLLFELIAVADGHRVDRNQIGDAYTRHLGVDPESRLMTAGMEYADSVNSLLHIQLEECRKSAVSAGSRGPQGCSDVIKELFH